MNKEWPICRLGDLGVTHFKGISPKEKNASGDTILIPSGAVFPSGIKMDKTKRFCGSRYAGVKSRLLRSGDILFNCGGVGTLGRSAIFDESVFDADAVSDSFVLAIRSDEIRVLCRFLFYFFQSERAAKQTEQNTRGTTGITSIRTEAIMGFELPLPPLADQLRIVRVLDEAFAELATAQANAEKNLQNARALFESHLQSVFTQRGPGWVEKRLADVADFKNGLNFTRQSKGQTLRMVGVGDFQEHSVVPVETLQSATIDGKISDDYLIRRDDILTVRSNGSKDLVGRCMLVPDVDGIISFSGFIIRIRFDRRALSPRFLLHFMKSSATRDRLTRDGGGANISNINQAKLSELPVSFPSFKQQQEIANRLDDLREETQRLASIYEQKQAALVKLKKSLLHQAFSGNL